MPETTPSLALSQLFNIRALTAMSDPRIHVFRTKNVSMTIMVAQKHRSLSVCLFLAALAGTGASRYTGGQKKCDNFWHGAGRFCWAFWL
ncbi:hypothetical protein [Yokenella regensburgei]|uniref:hypothetical protein n=1 Tax=Yokenella regensburgei TaxID=158877 RepID=UPI001375E2BF|nr:hypothetical protein [Yokenella regensburgei]KAF1369071.1 hypothetical protein FHR25_002351 [Yokenella regensburgei]